MIGRNWEGDQPRPVVGRCKLVLRANKKTKRQQHSLTQKLFGSGNTESKHLWITEAESAGYKFHSSDMISGKGGIISYLTDFRLS